MKKIDKIIYILQAYKDGKRVEYFFKNQWFGCQNLNIVMDYLFRNIDSIRVNEKPNTHSYKNTYTW